MKSKVLDKVPLESFHPTTLQNGLMRYKRQSNQEGIHCFLEADGEVKW